MPNRGPSNQWVEFAEQAIDLAVRNTQDIFASMLDLAGERPFGYEEADTLDQIADFLTLEADISGMAWQARIAQMAQTTGATPEDAQKHAWRESTRLYRIIAQMGQWDGSDEDRERAIRQGAMTAQLRLQMAASRQATKDVAAAEQVLALPKAQVMPPPPVLSPLALLGAEGVDPSMEAELMAAMAGGAGPLPGPTPIQGPFQGGEVPPLWPHMRYSPDQTNPNADYLGEPSVAT